ncbi:HK97 family phage prohead protease [Nocardioides jejuensis]|uniref:HK97 family phage prohead protease n=1 Tax=Nocardioides jejuensis TaxID=2502782 RepID=A0A4R1BZ89_9ACTN|nr:HK97 family phage prohead protease [Nocardioides jejuensis]TCJ23027.1 HK97 family phage prohead protease [Nocardioides jejuensis]
MTTTLEAAQARSQGVRALADRPSQRRNAEDPSSRPHVRATVRDMDVRELRDATTNTPTGMVEFTGYASVTDTSYEMYDFYGPYLEIVANAAFEETLNRADLDVPFVLGHDQMRRIARTVTGTLRLSVDEHGLRVEATLDMSDVDTAYIVPKLRAGLIDEMSFAFRITKGSWNPSYDIYTIEKVDMHRGDVAIVGWGANPYTDAGLRSQSAEAAPKTRSRVYDDELQDRIA